MKKVLIISYYFPPSGGPGVQRVLKFVKYLPKFGWEPIVLTVKDGDFPARDESLVKEIPGNIKVFRTDIFEPYNFYRRLTGRKHGTALDVDNINKGSGKNLSDKFAEFIRATFFIPDGRKGWLKYAFTEGKKIIESEKPDVIFSSSPPYTCALIAMKLKLYAKKNLNITLPWISDFRDAWTGYLTTPKRWFIPSLIDRHYEKKTLANSDAISMVANGIQNDFNEKYPEISNKKKYVLIRNGFDDDDFRTIDYKEHQNEKFTVVYTGSMYGKRNPYFFIDTMTDLVEKNKVEKNKIRFIIVGRCGNEIKEYISNSRIKDSIELVPYAPHEESIRYLFSADAMLLIIDEDKYSKMIISGKVFEYLGAALITKKPIIAITPEGEAADLIRETCSGYVIPHNDKELLSQTILNLYNRIFAGNIQKDVKINKDKVEQYERKNLTKKLADTLNNVLINLKNIKV